MTTPSISVEKIAKLARLHQSVTPEYVAKYHTELSTILEYVDQLSSAVFKNTIVNERTTTIGALRSDTPAVDQARTERIRTAIIKNFPHSSNSLLILPGIFE